MKNRYLKITASSFFILLALWVATPKVYIHALFHHNHSVKSAGNETTVKSASADDCDFDKYNKPVYFSIFKFICSFIPQRTTEEGKIEGLNLNLAGISYAINFFRGPPSNQ